MPRAGYRYWRTLTGAVAVVGSLWFSAAVRSEEPFQQFLDGLRERNYFDSAMEYLSQMSTSNLITPDQRTLIPYEEARTLIDDARAEKDTTQKNRKLEASEQKLQGFVKANSAHPMTPVARMQLGNVVVERGRMAVELASKPSKLGEKEKILTEARTLLDTAQKVFDEAETAFKTVLDQFPKFIAESDKEQINRRTLARRDYIQAQLLAAACAYEKAKTYPDKSPDGKKFLQQAADKYEKCYQAFRTILAGQLARIKQGQCYQDMGDTRRALGLYADILGQPDDIAEFRKLKASALYLSMQCWLSEGEKKYELAALKGEEWLQTGRTGEDRQADWLAIRYYTAVAEHLHSKELIESGKPVDVAKGNNMAKQILDHATKVSKIDGPYQEPAKTLLKERGKDGGDKEPTNFVQAVERGTLALNDMTEAATKIKVAPTLGAEEVAKIPEYQKQAIEKRAEANKYFQLALALREADTPKDDVNNVRYYVCFLRYQEQKYYDAAVLGEFVAKNYPDSAGARSCAKIALACYLQGYNDKTMPAEMRKFDYGKMLEIAEYCATRWTDEPETEDNWAILMSVAIGEHEMDNAVSFVKRIPEKSARRGDSELKLGQAYWSEYLMNLQKEEQERLPQAKADEFVKDAQSWLESGITRMRADVDSGMGNATVELVAAALSAAQIYAQSGQNEKAIGLLEDKKIGPLTLVEAKNAVITKADSPIALETLKVALRAYIAVSATDQKALDRAEKIMALLEATVLTGGKNDQQANLTAIYISMGKALEKQIQDDKAAGKTENLEKLTAGFEKFLTKIGEKADQFAPINWVAETYYSLGAGFDAPGAVLPDKAKNYFSTSLTTDAKLLSMIEKEKAAIVKKTDDDRKAVDLQRPKSKTTTGKEELARLEDIWQKSLKEVEKYDNMATSVNLRSAKSHRRLNDYKKAVDLLESILKEKNQLLEAQMEAAEAYMDWGDADNPLYFNLAMFGARKHKGPDGKERNVIWGWSLMSNMLIQDPKLQDQYHLTRINMARCHFRQAMHKDAAKNNLNKTDLLKLAFDDIRITTRFKNMQDVSPPIMAQYDEILKRVQTARNEKPIGMKAFEAPKTKTPTTDKAVTVGTK